MVNVPMTKALCLFLAEVWEPVWQVLSLAAFATHQFGAVCA